MILNIVNLNILTLLLEPVSSATADFNTYGYFSRGHHLNQNKSDRRKEKKPP